MENSKGNITELSVTNSQLSQGVNFLDPEQFDNIQRAALMLAKSELVPDMYKIVDEKNKGKAISNCVIALDIANRIGANILMVMQNLVIIHNRPSWSSKFLVATVNTCGRFEALKYKWEDLGEIKDVEYTEYEWDNGARKKMPKTKKFAGPIKNIQCVAWTKAKGSDEILESSPITIEMAIKEGWYTKSGSKWKTMPKQMLMYRSASFWTNAYAPELSMGMRTEDEVRDIVDAEFEEITEETPQDEINQNANKENIDLKVETPKQEEPKQPKETKTPEKKTGPSY